jgi:hypothetical protein
VAFLIPIMSRLRKKIRKTIPSTISSKKKKTVSLTNGVRKTGCPHVEN